jgi:uncharacterized protein
MDSPGPAAYGVLIVTLLVAHLVQGVTGFGAIVLALPVLALFFPLKVLIPALVLVNLAQVAWFAWRERRFIHRGHATSMALAAVLGLPIGYAIFRFLPAEELKVGLGFLVILVAGWNLAGPSSSRPAPRRAYHLLNLGGGIIQGALASGGPFLVIYAAAMLRDKASFRATLCAAFVVLDLVLSAANAATGCWSTGMVPLVLCGLPGMLVGTLLGTILHDHLPVRPFRVLVFALLLLSGVILLRPLLGAAR